MTTTPTLVDLRSDTVTRPSRAMRTAMAEAEVGDDVWREDPTARRLEERAAELLGMEAALFVPSGTMANQIAVMLLTRPGDEMVVARNAHVRLYETGGVAAWAGVQLVEVGEGGLYEPRDVDAVRQADDSHAPRTVALAIENTHNRAGGRPWPLPMLDALTDHARASNMNVHVDGARLWNAAAALEVPEARLTRGAHTVSACFSKGLGAPAGSVIAGSRAHIAEALRFRKRLGGGMRQVGILCAAALFALENHRPLLGEDHRRARRLAEGIGGIDGLHVDLGAVATNIVIFGAPDPRGLCARAAREGLLLAPFGTGSVRAVTHLDVDDAGIDRALAVLERIAR